jgi:peptide/nickel transport system ATP-binding protein
MTGQALLIRDLVVELPGCERARAVDGLSLDVVPGELTCLVGESGSGKTMTALAIMGLLPAGARVSGSIRLGGEEILGAPEPKLRALRATRMGMAFQEPMTALNPVMTCGAQVDEVFRLHLACGRTERRERTMAALAEAGLKDVERITASYPHQLSGGQRQRVVIAMALALRPMLFIADEPTTALDMTTQAQILAQMRAIKAERGMATLFITHDFGIVEDIADGVVVLKDGRLIEAGRTTAVLDRPTAAYTKTLIAAIPRIEPRPVAAKPSGAPLLLSVEGLGKIYRDRHRVFLRRSVIGAADVSFRLPRGQTLGIIGESGSGKSTVARCVARLIAPDSGRLLLDGEDLTALRGSALRRFRRRVQIVFQDPYRSLDPRQTIANALSEGPMNYGATRAEARACAARCLEMVRLDGGALERYPHQFSGGQRQRICIARALAMQPVLLIADEATSALDVSIQAEILDLLQDLRDRLALSMLVVTHDLRVAAKLCDTVVVMRDGRIVEAGPPGQIFTGPAHPYTAALLAAAPGRSGMVGPASNPVKSNRNPSG